MLKNQQKYFSEASLLQATKGVALFKPAELERLAHAPKTLAALEDAHIYFVCQRPRVRIDAAERRPYRITDASSKFSRGLRAWSLLASP
jgi:hypothetical protein